MVKAGASTSATTDQPDIQVENADKMIAKIAKVFNCPVCLTLPACDIYQCNEGHLICKDCYTKLNSKSPTSCPTCRTTMPRVPIRNRAAEQVNSCL